jgi:methyl-accepting chemotaxis protein
VSKMPTVNESIPEESVGTKNNRRHKVIVNKTLQHRLILTTMWIPCLCLSMSSVLLAMFCQRLYTEATLSEAELPSIVPVFLSSVGFVVLATVFTVIHGVRLSQRIAGPIVNIGRTLGRVTDGESSARVHIRRADLLTDAADHINGFLDWLEEHPPSESVREEQQEGTAAPTPETTLSTTPR